MLQNRTLSIPSIHLVRRLLKRWGADLARRVWLLPTDFGEELLQLRLKGSVLGTLVKFADEVASMFESIARELKRSLA